jgi:phenylacetate-CoA ligase
MKYLLHRPAEQLEAHQQKRFRRILRHAYDHSPFYRRLYRGLDLDRCLITELPPVTKAELMKHFDEVVTDPRINKVDLERFVADTSNVGKLYLGKYVPCHTSGSQGQPMLIVQPPVAIDTTFAAQIARAHNQPTNPASAIRRLRNPTRWAILLLRPGFFPSGVAFGYMPKALHRFARILRLDLTAPLASIVERLNAFHPQFITAYAHVLEQLGHEERAGRLKLRAGGQLEMLASMSEPLYPETRQFLEETFGIHVANHYAMGECMGLGIGCPRSTGAHLNIDLGILEVCDEAGRSVPDGTAGKKIFVTNLVNTVQPFIRYEVDDIVSLSGEPCPCGSPLPLINAIAGRNNDRIWIDTPAGVREIPGYFFVSALHELTDLGEFQLVQIERNRFELLAQPVPGTTLSADDIRQVLHKTFAREHLADLLHVDIHLKSSLPPDPRSGKHRRFISKVPPPDTQCLTPGTPVVHEATGLRLSV